MAKADDDKPETLRIVSTRGGYAAFVSPSPQPVAVFTSGLELLDWVADRVAGWEARRSGGDSPTAGGDAERTEGTGPGEVNVDR